MKRLDLPKLNLVETGRRIDAIRAAKKMTVTDLREAFGFNTPQAIYKWLRGETCPNVDNLLILAWIFDMSIDEIIVADYPEITASKGPD